MKRQFLVSSAFLVVSAVKDQYGANCSPDRACCDLTPADTVFNANAGSGLSCASYLSSDGVFTNRQQVCGSDQVTDNTVRGKFPDATFAVDLCKFSCGTCTVHRALPIGEPGEIDPHCFNVLPWGTAGFFPQGCSAYEWDGVKAGSCEIDSMRRQCAWSCGQCALKGDLAMRKDRCPPGYQSASAAGFNPDLGLDPGECIDGCFEDVDYINRFISLKVMTPGSTCYDRPNGNYQNVINYKTFDEALNPLTYTHFVGSSGLTFPVSYDIKNPWYYSRFDQSFAPTPSPTAAPPPISFTNTFDFAACVGSETFQTVIPFKDETRVVGLLASGVFSPKVYLRAEADVDVQLFDVETDTINFPETGRAIIAYCGEDFCNYGPLTVDVPTTQEYDPGNGKTPFMIYYSGYYGLDESTDGYEDVFVTGVLSTTLMMRLLAYSNVTVLSTVNYEWEGKDTECCKNADVDCGDDFETDLEFRQFVRVGTIPAGVTNVEIRLEPVGNREVDIDLALYDLTNEEPLIGYCSQEDFVDPDECVKRYYGKVLNQYFPDEKEHNGLSYFWSGYFGVDTEEEYCPGCEIIRITGTTNVDLEMRTYGFEKGVGKVTYSYTPLERNPGV